MSINKDLLGKGIKQLLVLLLLFIITPVTMNVSFKALKKFEDDSIWIAYLLLALSAILVFVTLLLAFKTFQLLIASLFDKK